MRKKTVSDVHLRDKKILLRVDFNVPVHKGKITDNFRIKSSLEVIEYLIKRGAKIVIVSHRGRPEGKVDPNLSMEVCAKELSRLLNKEVFFIKKTIGFEVERSVNKLQSAEILFLENVRFHTEEESKDDSIRLRFAKHLAEPFDLVINDAFGVSHRKNASTYDVGLVKEMVMGFLMEKEVLQLSKLISRPKRPFVAIMGGAKVSDKLGIIGNLLPKVDYLLIGGAMVYTFYEALGLKVGKCLVEKEKIAICKALYQENFAKIILADDLIVAEGFDFRQMQVLGALEIRSKEKIKREDMGVDIGPVSLQSFKEFIGKASTILWNGPMGIFECEQTAVGSMEVAKMISEATKHGAFTVVGGGDSVSAIQKSGFFESVSHVSTGGGASLEFLSGLKLPGLEVIAEV